MRNTPVLQNSITPLARIRGQLVRRSPSSVLSTAHVGLPSEARSTTKTWAKSEGRGRGRSACWTISWSRTGTSFKSFALEPDSFCESPRLTPKNDQYSVGLAVNSERMGLMEASDLERQVISGRIPITNHLHHSTRPKLAHGGPLTPPLRATSG